MTLGCVKLKPGRFKSSGRESCQALPNVSQPTHMFRQNAPPSIAELLNAPCRNDAIIRWPLAFACQLTTTAFRRLPRRVVLRQFSHSRLRVEEAAPMQHGLNSELKDAPVTVGGDSGVESKYIPSAAVLGANGEATVAVPHGMSGKTSCRIVWQ